MDIGRALMLGVVALMLLGMLALVVWIFRVVIQSTRGIVQTVTAGPTDALRELGLTVTSDAAGGEGSGQWSGVGVKVIWQMTAAPYAGDYTPPPEFSTTVVAFFSPPLTLGLEAYEEAGAPPCGIHGLDGRLGINAPTPAVGGLLSACAPHLRHALDAPGQVLMADAHVAFRFAEIVTAKDALKEALDGTTTLHNALRQNA